jgi:porphobilinogen synthase
MKETRLSPDNFIAPAFVVPGTNLRQEIGSMPGVSRLSRDLLAHEAKELWDLGIRSMLIFGVPERRMRDDSATIALDEKGLIPQAVRAIKETVSDMIVATDVCLCAYTSHGHCGLVDNEGNILNDESVELISRMSLAHAKAGADVVAPSDMMDGRVGAIRRVLDEQGYEDTAIMSYAAKYASSFYGPFRDAADSAPAFGDRRTHQMEPANAREALREVDLDIKEGADIVMIKPAMAYLDVIAKVKDRVHVPVAAYQVSGEYSMIKAAASKGWLDEKEVAMESLISIKRAGADLIISYFARELAKDF